MKKKVTPKTEQPRTFPFSSHGPEVQFGQHVIPRDNKLAKKLGIPAKSKIIVFAGCYGDWANQLGRRNNVHYSDIDPNMVEWVNAYQNNIQKHIIADAGTIPSKTRQYDYSFSFEPIFGETTTKLAIMRSLLNNAGGIITERPGIIEVYSKVNIEDTMNKLAKVYGANYEKKRTEINGEFFTELVRNKGVYNTKKININLHKITTNPQARKKAAIDILVLSVLNKIKMPRPQLIESLQRIKELTLA